MSEWLGPLLSGYLDERNRIVDRHEREAERNAARESHIFSLLAQSPDPKIRTAAILGMTEAASGKPRKGGIWDKWYGKQAGSPHFARIEELINTPEDVEEMTPGLPSQQISGTQSLPMAGSQGGPPMPQGNLRGGQPVQQAERQPVPEGLPLPSPDQFGGQVMQEAPPVAGMPTPPNFSAQTVAAQPPPPPPPSMQPQMAPPLTRTPATGEQGYGTQMVSRPRRVVRTPAEEAEETAIGRARGDIFGEIEGGVAAGIPRAEMLQLIAEKYKRGIRGAGGAVRALEGEWVDDQGQVHQTTAVFDPATRQFTEAGTERILPNFRQSYAPRAMGQDREALARVMFPDHFARGGTAANLPGEQMAQVDQAVLKRAQDLSYQRGVGSGTAAADIPLSTQQTFQAYGDLKQSLEKSEGPARELRRQVAIMETGLQAARAGNAAAGAQAVLVTFQKILDPTSVVRESEYARSPAGQSLMNRIEGFIERLSVGGAGIPVAELENFAVLAKQFTAGAEAHAAAERQRVTQLAQAYKLDPSLILPPPAVTPPPAAAGAIKIGDIVGDPSTPGVQYRVDRLGPNGELIKEGLTPIPKR